MQITKADDGEHNFGHRVPYSLPDGILYTMLEQTTCGLAGAAVVVGWTIPTSTSIWSPQTVRRNTRRHATEGPATFSGSAIKL